MRSFRLSPQAFRWITAAAVTALTAIIVTGAAVRLTKSGLGCPTWPNCENGSLVPQGETGFHGDIEFYNRLVTGAVSVAVAVAVLGSYRRWPKRRDLIWLSWGLVAGVFANAILGAFVVFFSLTPGLVISHFLLSMLLLWDGVVLHHRASLPDPPTVRRPAAPAAMLWLGRAMVLAAAVVIVLGTVVTGAGPHGGDADVGRLAIPLPDAARAHGTAEVCFLALTVTFLLLVYRLRLSAGIRRRAQRLLLVMILQGALGYLQYFRSAGIDVFGVHLAQEWMIGLHVLGAALVWMATVATVLSLWDCLPAPPAPPEPPVELTGDVAGTAPAVALIP